MFVGTYEHSLDEKGRMVLPAVFRGRLAEGCVVTKLDGCLGIWTAEEFANVAGRMLDRVKAGQADRRVVRSFSADAQQVTPDGQGRVVMPQRLRDFAGLSGDVIVNGALDHIEVWAPQRWTAVNEGGEESLGGGDDPLSGLGI